MAGSNGATWSWASPTARTVEVKEGLRSGEQVILDPKPFLSDEQQAGLKAEREAWARNAAARAARLKGRGTPGRTAERQYWKLLMAVS